MIVLLGELELLTKYHFTAGVLVLSKAAEIRQHLASSLDESTLK